MSEELKVPVSIDCWSCGTCMTLEERGDNDGDCPICNAEIDLEPYLAKALTGHSVRDARIAEMQERFDSAAFRTSLIGRLEIENKQLRAENTALKAQELAESDYYRSMLRAVLKDIRDEIPRGGLPQSWNDIADSISASLHRPLYATPVVSAEQQGVADVSAMARVLADRNADACNVNREDNWAIYGQDYIDDVRAMLAAPAPSTTEGQGDE